jgi:hypothetical protein
MSPGRLVKEGPGCVVSGAKLGFLEFKRSGQG